MLSFKITFLSLVKNKKHTTVCLEAVPSAISFACHLLKLLVLHPRFVFLGVFVCYISPPSWFYYQVVIYTSYVSLGQALREELFWLFIDGFIS